MSTQLERSWGRFFKSGFYAEGWNLKIDPKAAEREVDGVLNLLNPPAGSHIIDWCGGWGRHAVLLAQRGYKVTLLDFAPSHIDRARSLAEQVGVNIELICADFRQTPPNIQADFAVNMFTAGIGYLTEEDDVLALTSLRAALKPRAGVIVDTMNLFFLAKNYTPRGWRESDDKSLRLFEKREFNFLNNRNASETTMVRAGQEEVQTLDHRIYTPAELAKVLELAGFSVTNLWGGFDGCEFDFDSPRIVMMAKK